MKYAMEFISEMNGLDREKDIRFLPFGNPWLFQESLSLNPNTTQIGLIFCNGEWPLKGIDLPCKLDKLSNQKELIFYSIVYNYTLYYKSPILTDWKNAFPKDPLTLSLKYSLDNALLSYFATNGNFSKIKEEARNPRLVIETQDFPKASNRFNQNYDVVGQYGAFYFFVPYMVGFIMLIGELLKEKTKKLRQGLVVMGMTSTSYWLSWFTVSIALNGMITASLILAGLIFKFEFFIKTPIMYFHLFILL